MNFVVFQKVGLSEVKDFEGLGSGDEAAFDAQSLLSDGLSADIKMLLGQVFSILLVQILSHFHLAGFLSVVWLLRRYSPYLLAPEE